MPKGRKRKQRPVAETMPPTIEREQHNTFRSAGMARRVSPVTAEQARRALSTRAIQIAAEFGAQYVRLASGHRVVIANHAVVTVQPVEHFKRQIHRHGLGRYGKSPYQQEHDHDRHPYD